MAGIALGALLCVGVARVPLEGSAPIESLRAELAARLGARVELGAARLDPLGARGIVLEDLALAGRGWSLSLDRAVWRPVPAGLLAADGRGSLHARSFVLAVDPDRLDPGERAASLFEGFGATENASLASLALSGGRLVLAEGAPLLHDVSIEVGGAARFEARGRQRGGGRLDLRGRRTPDGALEVDLFLEALAVDPVERRLAEALPERMLPALGISVAGHWNARFESAGHRRHRFGLELYAESPDAPDESGGAEPAPRLRMQARGTLATRPDPAAPGGRVFVSGSHAVLNGRVRRLRTAGAGVPGMQISGPFSASLALAGPAQGPSLHGSLFLDEAHVRVGEAMRKPCGVRARLRFDSDTQHDAEIAEHGPAPRATRVTLDLGALRLALVRRGGGPFEGASDWVSLGDVASWLPAAEGRASGGRVRVTSLRLTGADAYDAELEFEAATFEGRRSPLPLSALTGRGRLTPAGFTAQGFAGVLAGVPVRLDISALRSIGAAAPRMRFAVRADEIDLAGLGVPLVSAEGEAWSGPLPSALVAAAEPPMALLRRRRESLAQLGVAAGRFEVARLRAGAELLSDVVIDVGLQALRLDVSRLSFRQRGQRASYSGSIDLDRLVPIVEFASIP